MISGSARAQQTDTDIYYTRDPHNVALFGELMIGEATATQESNSREQAREQPRRAIWEGNAGSNAGRQSGRTIQESNTREQSRRALQ